MEHAFLDGRPLMLDGMKPDATVSAVIEHARTVLNEPDAIILEIICDGDAITADNLDEALSAPLDQYARLELISGSPRKVVADTLHASRRSIADSSELAALAANELASGDLSKGMQRLIDCVDIWSRTHEAMVSGAHLLRLDLESLVIQDRRVVEWLRQPAAKLREIRDAIESRDHVLLGDILRYEMQEFLESWDQMLGAYAYHVQAQDAAAGSA